MYNRTKLNSFNEDVMYNKTSKYLLPQMKYIFTPNEMQYVSNIDWITCAIYDEKYNVPFDNNIYCVFSANTELDYSILKENQYYVDDYPFIDDKLDKHVIVFTLPVKCMYHFVRGNYSKMYTREEINDLFPEKMYNNNIEYFTDVFSILTKREDYIELFKDKIAEEFNTTTVPENKIKEYDFPPLMENEILNYSNFTYTQNIQNELQSIFE